MKLIFKSPFYRMTSFTLGARWSTNRPIQITSNYNMVWAPNYDQAYSLDTTNTTAENGVVIYGSPIGSRWKPLPTQQKIIPPAFGEKRLWYHDWQVAELVSPFEKGPWY